MSETIVLGILLKEGTLTAAKIAKSAHMKRPTTYDTLKELIQKGLVNEVRDNAVLQFQAIDADLLPNYVARKRKDLEKREEELRQILSELREMRLKGRRLPTVHIVEGPMEAFVGTEVRKMSTFLPEVSSGGVDIAIQKDEVVFTKDSETNPVTVSIEDAAIAHTMRKIFSYIEKRP